MTQNKLTPPLKIALIGCGQIGRLHAERLSRDERVRIAAFCDSQHAAAEVLRREFSPEAVVVSDLEELFASTTVDAVVICTPTNLHYEQVIACRQRGLPVLCEKPLAETRTRIADLSTADQDGGPLLSVAYQRRYWPIYRTLRRELQSERHGPLLSVTFDMAERWQQTIGGTWRDEPSHNPGGFLGDAGSHKIDLLFFLTGLKPEGVFALSRRHGSQVEVVTSVTGKLAGDILFSLNLVGNSEHWHEDLHFYCEHADLIVKEDRLWLARNNQLEEITIEQIETNPDSGFVDCLTEDAENWAPAGCALPVADFTAAVLESARSGVWVALEPQ